MATSFRPPKTTLYQGVGFTALFLIVTLAYGSVFVLSKPQVQGFRNNESANRVAYFGIAVFGTMTLLSIYGLSTYCLTRFELNGTKIILCSPLRKLELDASSVRELAWNPKVRAGALKFRTLAGQASLYLANFSREDRLNIIRCVHSLFPVTIQTGWDAFCHLVALPLRDGRRPRQPGVVRIDPLTLPKHSRIFVTRRRYDWFFGSLFLIGIVGASILWFEASNPRAFIIPFLVAIFWSLLRFSTPKEGEWRPKWTGTKECKLTGIAHITMPVMYAGVLICGWLGLNGMLVMWSGLIFMAILCAIVMRQRRKGAGEQRARDASEAVLSVQRWEAGELSS